MCDLNEPSIQYLQKWMKFDLFFFGFEIPKKL